MFDAMEPLVQFSPLAGRLVEEIVPGKANTKAEFENDMAAANGADRTMYGYAPLSGCPDSKQTQVLFVLRDGSDAASAQAVMDALGLARLAEEQHFLLLFPNPSALGWNSEEDIDFLSRCFARLRAASLRVNGFNGMLFYLAVSPAASALLADLIALRPANVTAAMLDTLPSDYTLPEKAVNAECAAWCPHGPVAEYLRKANRVRTQTAAAGMECLTGENPEVRLFIGEQGISAATVRTAWELLFSPSRRWQNDVHGHYQHRTDFTVRGFTAHIKDASLGVNDGFEHTWFEYVPPQLRGTTEKVPLVFYFHGINCVPLYGAEQSNWHDIADRENLIVVYPAPARAKCWNIYDLPTMPKDFDFVLALLEHMKQVHPIDESRVYLSGFSMGGMMCHALSAAYPELFAAAAPNNAFAFHRFNDPVVTLSPFLRGVPEEEIGHISYSVQLADRKKAADPGLRMPVFQCAGEIDKLMGLWPVCEDTDDARVQTLRWWQEYNNIPLRGLDASAFSGLEASESDALDTLGRFFHQRWLSAGETALPLLELVVAKRMAHAIDPVQVEWAWDYMKHFSRAADGSLLYR